MMMMMGFGFVVPLVLIGGIAYALGWRPQFNPTNPEPAAQTPVELLKARYARGEISRAEYQQVHRELEG